jgi:membrane protease YdiL (CAAX protease family)
METVGKESPADSGAVVHDVRRSYFRDVPWLWRDVVFCFAPSVLYAPARRLLPLTVVGWLQTFWLPTGLVLNVWLIGYACWAARRRRGALPALPRIRKVLGQIPWLFAMVPAVFVVMSIFYTVAAIVLGSGAEPPSEGWAPMARSASRAELIGFAIMAITVAPISEELAFRGLLYNKLRHALPMPLALLLQAIAFGFTHYSLGSEFACGIAGGSLLIGVFYDWRKTLVAPMLMHAGVNVIGLVIVLTSLAAEANSPRLGVYVETGEKGCIVTKVFVGSTAESAGLKAGDVLTAIDGGAVTNFRELTWVIRQREFGEKVKIDFMRNGQPQQVEAVLTRPNDRGTEKSRE